MICKFGKEHVECMDTDNLGHCTLKQGEPCDYLQRKSSMFFREKLPGDSSEISDEESHA